MPAAVAIPAVASLAGTVIQSRGNNRALSYQRRAADQQIQLERERDAARGARYERAYSSYEAEKKQYDQMRRALLAQYGVNLGDAPAGGGGDVRAGGGGGAPNATLGDMMGWQPGGAPTAQMLPQGGTPATPGAPAGPAGPAGPEGPGGPGAEGDTFDWRNYGVR